MRVLLVNTNRQKSPQTLVPLGVCCLASAGAAAGHEVRVLDLCFERKPSSAVRNAVGGWTPGVVGLSIRNLDNCDFDSPRSYLPEVVSVARACRDAGSARIVIGGPAVSHAPAALLNMLQADAAVVGEGELSFPALLGAVEAGGPMDDLPGVVTAGGASHASAPLITDLDTLPDPSPERWLDLKRYAAYGAAMPVQTKRGCALACEYCCYPALEGPRWRLRDPEWVAGQAAASAGSGLRLVEFVDSVFGLPTDHAIASCEAIVRASGTPPLTTLDLNPAGCVPELIDAMNAAGFTAVGISAESASDTVLRSLGKNYTAEKLYAAADAARGLNARRIWMLLVGAPGETEDTVTETVRFVESLPHSDLVMVSQGIRVLPGAPIHRKLVAQGEIDPADDLTRPVFYHSPHISPQRAREILAGAKFPSANFSTLSDGGHPLAPLAQRLAAAVGARPPYWRHLRLINRTRRLLRL